MKPHNHLTILPSVRLSIRRRTEHDLDVVVTEQGVADLRGLSPRERAPTIIKKCAHSDCRDMLTDYYEKSLYECLKRGAGHEPHMLTVSVFWVHFWVCEELGLILCLVSLMVWLARGF
jgi:acyl-CoA hydrolase